MSHAILFLCVANSARSQMAEGLARAMNLDGVELFSAGSRPAVINPMAVAALAERGIAIDGQVAKGIDAVPLDRVQTVITLCEEELCPNLPRGTKHLHWPMPDPAAATGSVEDRFESFREVRDMIDERLRGWLRASDRDSAIA